MSKPVKPFHFKQFTIEHDKCAMKVGFDGALLGAWANHSTSGSILDIGTGSGLISLIIRQRFPIASITSIEPNKNALIQAEINFSNSPFEKKITLVNSNLQSFNSNDKFDMILSNPPFFAEDTGGDDHDRNEARQEKFLPLEYLLSKTKDLLNPLGKFFLVYPTWESDRINDLSKKLNLYISNQTTIYSRIEKPSKRTIFEFQLSPCTTIHSSFISGNQDVGYSEDYKQLMRDFYTIF